MADKAHDLEAIRDAVVEAAKVSAGLWLSYLFVLFYLLVAAGGVTHKDLLLEHPVRLPFLNVDLPLLGFFGLDRRFFWSSMRMCCFISACLPARYANSIKNYATQIDPGHGESETRVRLQRQLPNDIFVQLLAGAPEVHKGVTGVLLKLIAWISQVPVP
jgi:hypothetical protein